MATSPIVTAEELAKQSEEQPVVEFSTENPQTIDPQEQLQEYDLSDEDKGRLVKIVTSYRSQWAPDRILRMPNWMKNVYFSRGIQILGWDKQLGTYFDALAYYRQQGQTTDGDDTYLERYTNNLTLMFEDAFVGTMSRGVPPTIIKPENAEVLDDVTTAKAGQEAISIIERMNKIRQLVRIENDLLYLFGVYFKHTRIVLDGPRAGWEEEDIFGAVSVDKPDRFVCPQCSTETPISETSGDDGRACKGCGSPVGPADFYPAESDEFESVVGKKRTPKAMVRWSAHGPMEVDADPEAEDLCDTPILALDREIDIGTARMTFPTMLDKIKEGASTSTTPNAEYEKLRRNEMYSYGAGYTTDSSQTRVTYSRVWMQPQTFYREYDPQKDENGECFTDRMLRKFPNGCVLSMVGPDVMNIRPAILEKEWSCCRLREGKGLYPPSIADNVVPFNERFNDTLDLIDDWVQRCGMGMILADSTKVDQRKLAGKQMGAGIFNFVTSKGAGVDKPLEESIVQLKFSIDQFMTTYPSMLLNYCELISGMVPQSFGAGTSEGVETAAGQKQQLDQAQSRMNPFWENLKEEHAIASQNAIEALQKAMKAGLIREIWDVIQTNGSEFRNNYVNLDKMNGHVRVYPDIDQGLPQSPEQIREIWRFVVDQVGAGNPVAKELLELVPNQEAAIAALGTPDTVLPGGAQRARTLQHINTLLEQNWVQTIAPTGQVALDLPVKPEKNVEDFGTLRDTIRLWRQENWDVSRSNPDGWKRLDAYYELAIQLELQVAVEEGQRHAKATQAAAPQQQPDPTLEAARAELLNKARGEIDRLADLSQLPPLGKNGSISGQVSAAKEIVDSALKAATAGQ